MCPQLCVLVLLFFLFLFFFQILLLFVLPVLDRVYDDVSSTVYVFSLQILLLVALVLDSVYDDVYSSVYVFFPFSFLQILLLFVLLVVLSLVCAVANSVWTGRHSNKDWYLFFDGQSQQPVCASWCVSVYVWVFEYACMSAVCVCCVCVDWLVICIII